MTVARTTDSRSAENALLGQRFLHGGIPEAGDPIGGGALLIGKACRKSDRLLVARPLGHSLQLLVAGDLEVLECKGEPGQLRRRVRLSSEEGSEVKATEAHPDVLDSAR